MAGKKKSSKGKERPPEVDKLIKPAIAVALAVMLFQFFMGINSEVRMELKYRLRIDLFLFK